MDDDVKDLLAEIEERNVILQSDTVPATEIVSALLLIARIGVLMLAEIKKFDKTIVVNNHIEIPSVEDARADHW